MAKSVSARLQLLRTKLIRFWKAILDRAEEFLTNRNNYLLILFFLYLLLIPCFALIYSVLYRGNRQRFAFNQDIALAQRQIVKASTQLEIEHKTRLLEPLRDLSTQLSEEKTTSLQFPKWYENYNLKVYSDHYHYVCTVRVLASPVGAPPVSIPILIIRKTDGQEIERFDLPDGLECPTASADVKPFSTNLVSNLEKDLTQSQRRLESLKDDFPEVWSYWDFVYFSTVTQTTVGYGDIVPNSTSVRVVVVVQLVLGTGLLVVGLNLVLRNRSEKTNGNPTQ